MVLKPRVLVETDPDRKRQLQMQLTAQLPQWFGKPDSSAKYAEQRHSGANGTNQKRELNSQQTFARHAYLSVVASEPFIFH
jgi:hypothetical protein